MMQEIQDKHTIFRTVKAHEELIGQKVDQGIGCQRKPNNDLDIHRVQEVNNVNNQQHINIHPYKKKVKVDNVNQGLQCKPLEVIA